MLVLPERERTKKGAIGVETKGVTCKIPLDLHNQISEEIRETESTMSKFIEMIIREHYEKGANRIMEKGRTLPHGLDTVRTPLLEKLPTTAEPISALRVVHRF